MPIIRTRVLPDSLGSALYSTDQTSGTSSIVSVYCSIKGPLPVKGKLELENRAAIKCTWKSLASESSDSTVYNLLSTDTNLPDGPNEPVSRADLSPVTCLNDTFSYKSPGEIEHFIHDLLSEVTLTYLFPRSGFLFSFFVFHADAKTTVHETMACAINCLSAALIDSGIPIKHMISATTFSIPNSPGSSVLLVAASNAPKDHVLAIDVVGGNTTTASSLTEDLIIANNHVNEAHIEAIKAHFRD